MLAEFYTRFNQGIKIKMKLDIIYATQTGNAEAVANDLSRLAKTKGFIVNINEMNFYTMDQFRKLENVAIVTSTYGEEVPEMGIEFWSDLRLQNQN